MRPVIELLRIEESLFLGTFGVLRINKESFCVTLEPADLLNKQNVSSIPAQQYICRRHESPRYGETFIVTNVPDRDLVLFHPGNTIEDTKGCILLAQYFGKLKGDRAVLNSGATFQAFMKIMKESNEFHLTIREIY